MRGLKVAIAVMTVLIVAGVAVIGVTIAQRLGGGGAPAQAARAVLDEPEGTRIASVSAGPDRLALHLQGGGPDRVVVLDTKTGRPVLHAGLAR